MNDPTDSPIHAAQAGNGTAGRHHPKTSDLLALYITRYRTLEQWYAEAVLRNVESINVIRDQDETIARLEMALADRERMLAASECRRPVEETVVVRLRREAIDACRALRDRVALFLSRHEPFPQMQGWNHCQVARAFLAWVLCDVGPPHRPLFGLGQDLVAALGLLGYGDHFPEYKTARNAIERLGWTATAPDDIATTERAG